MVKALIKENPIMTRSSTVQVSPILTLLNAHLFVDCFKNPYILNGTFSLGKC